MKKRLNILAAALVLGAATAMAVEYRAADIVRTVDVRVPGLSGDGTMEIANEDWVDYFVEVWPDQFTINFYYADRVSGGNGFILPSGARARIASPRHIWNLYGNNGRSLMVGVHHDRTTPVRLTPEGDNGLIGMRAIVHDGHKDTGELLMAWQQRGPEGWPPPEQPMVYYDDGDYPYYDDAYPQYYDDGPRPHRRPPHREPPHRNPPPPPERPHHSGPPIQMPPPDRPQHYKPPIQIPDRQPPQHRNPLIYRR